MKTNFFREDVIEIKDQHYLLGQEDELGRKRIVPIDDRVENSNDQKIRETIELAFHESPTVNSTFVKVFVHSGHVTLVGTVTNLNQKFECEDLVHNVSGVHSVINDLEIKGPKRIESPPLDEFGYH